MSFLVHTVVDEEQGLRLDVLLASLVDVQSRSQAVKLIESGAVTINDAAATTKKRIVLTGDTVAYDNAILRTKPLELMPDYIDLDIRFEDNDLIVLSKQADLVCHPAQGHERGTLVNALIAHAGYGNLSQIQGSDRPGIVHRLDKDTSGLMVVGKTDEAALALQSQLKARALDRRYLTLVHGYIAPDTGMIDAPIGRGEADRLKMAVSESLQARDALTTFSVLERFEAGRFDEGYSLLECKLYTGRTHQIRVHMAYISHPVIGDQLYGRKHGKADLGLERQFLHSWHLSFEHPITGVSMDFTDPLPADLQKPLDSLATRSMGRTTAHEDRMAK